MGSKAGKADKKVHFRDSSSREVMITYKRRRRQEPQPQPQPQAEAEARAQPEPQPRPELEHNAADVPVQQNKVTFWKSKDMGWKYGIMIDENRQHWKCMYCGLIRYGGGVSRLKRHLAGDLDVKMCPKVPADVAEEIREHLRKKRERRRKRAAQNGGNNMKIKSSYGDVMIKKDLLPADFGVPAEMDTNVLEEVTNQNNMVHQDPTCPKIPLLRTKDIGWEHAVDLDGNKRRWQCKFCSLCRSGGVTTLKAHLTDDCPNVPEEISKKVKNFIQEKKATRLLFSNFAFTVDEDQVSDTQIQEEGTVQCENDQQPSRNATHMQTLDKFPINEVGNGTNQCAAESKGQPVEHCDQPEEQCAMDHGMMHQIISNKPQTSNKNSKNTKILKRHRKRGFSTRKHIVIVDASARHWRCRYCGMDGYGKKFRLHYHLAGAFRQLKCPHVPKKVFAKAKHYVRTKKKLERVKSGQQISSRIHIIGQSGEELQNLGPLSGNLCQLPTKDESSEPIKEERPQEIILFSDANDSEKQRSYYWTYVLDGLMHLPDVQEGAGIWTCIRDALLYGCAQFGTVPDTVEQADGTVNVNTANCQNVLMDVLRSEDFVLLCDVLCRTVHQDEERTRYFDFSVIDSRMKNGNYGHEPGLFMHDLKRVWEDLKIAGQHIIGLSNSLSSLTETSYENMVGRQSESGDNELKGAMATSSGPTNLVESNALVPSSSEGVNQLQQSDPVDLDQPDPLDVSDVQKDSTCNQCGKEARGGGVLTCTKCMGSCHISCMEPPVPSISPESWYCRTCSMEKPIEGDMVLAHYQTNCLHEDCVACDRLEVCSSPNCEDPPIDNSRAVVIYSMGSVEDTELPELDTVGSCKICGDPEEEDKRFLICGHAHCPYKYYHIRCLKSKQIASDVQRDKPCWYCPSCLCRVCLSDKDDDLTILCDGCDEAYHLYCITPRRTSIPKGKWYCSSCNMKRAKGGMRQYERRMLKLHRKVDTRLQSRNCDGINLLLSAAEQLSAGEQLVGCIN
ncbi:hypothetical protein EJB05_15943 [Eragrostis curvula]|uniref:PHD-type domain-containing protein n=1 Tax=Eragrostis curvula TaxID=38414 RepID=A0A5J9VFH0_9POAL|nr:hypothetical protein EJB05_15943 [Eragrostis curvula]